MPFVTADDLDLTQREHARCIAGEQTIEDRLVEKAEAADRRDFTGQRSLGQMRREEQHKFLFGG